ncbi:MAG: phosphoribosyltransferase [Archangium sp.]|nr:phosphoribosyltransferase [Archangium sp.]
MRLFSDRQQAGRVLAVALKAYRARSDLMVLGIPRGGMPVAAEVASRLGAPLDVFVVRKLGVPWADEVSMGAIASGGNVEFDNGIVSQFKVSQFELEAVLARERAELRREERFYRGERRPLSLTGKTVIVVDDGIDSGATMRAAVHGLRRFGPKFVVAAVPVADTSLHDTGSLDADDFVCSITREPIHAVGAWYEDYDAVTDDEVRTLLHDADDSAGQGHALAF